MKYKKPILLRFVSVIILKIYTSCFLKLKIKKDWNLPKGPKILAVNHPTTSDPFIIYSLFPNAKMLISKHVYAIKPLGYIFNKLGHIRVDGDNGQVAYNEAKKALENGNDIVIFPEGPLCKNRLTLQEIKTGMVRLALETNCPIVPIGIHTQEEGFKKGHIKNSKKEKLHPVWYLFNKYIISIGQSIRLKGSVNNRELVRKKSRYIKEVIQSLVRKPEFI
jgi:1-acyl-sn-glycerol-3-phosphate acyltransferase